MKGCKNRVTQISEAIDGRLDEKTAAELMAHLETCAACRRVDAALRQTVFAIRSVPARPAPPDMADRVRQRLKQRPAARDFRSIGHQPWIRIALAASLLMGVSMYAFFRPASPPALESEEMNRMETREKSEPGDYEDIMETDVPSRDPRPPQPAMDPAPEPGPAIPLEIAKSPVKSRDIYASRREPAPNAERPAPADRVAPETAGAPSRGVAETARRRERRREPAHDALGFSDLDVPAPPALDMIEVGAAGERPLGKRDPGPEYLAQQSMAWATDLYRELVSDHQGNVFFSPCSIYSVLGMATAGARGETASQIAGLMHWPFEHAALHPAFRAFHRRLTAAARDHGHTLNIANGLCLTRGDVDSAFKTLLRDKYQADIFTGDAAEINAWVARQTEGRIESIIDRLSPESVCVLLNAIYFKGTWSEAFDPDHTHDAPFYPSPDRQVTTPMMTREGRYRLLQDEDVQALAIPYGGDQLSLIVVLPGEDREWRHLEDRWTASVARDVTARLREQPVREVRVFLPRFTFETDDGLIAALRRLGMRDAFLEGVADFSATGWPPGELWISQIKHKAFVEVNEEGTEAAAATAVEMRTTAIQPPPPVFRADRPFLFLIQDHQTGGILFMGRLHDPTAS